MAQQQQLEEVEVERRRIVGKWETYTETVTRVKRIITICDICGNNDHDDSADFGRVTVERLASSTRRGTDLVHEFDICDGCWPVLVKWIAGHQGNEPREYERDYG